MGLLVAVAAIIASCGGSSATGSIPPGVDRALPASTYPAQEAVLRAWVAGERQFYAYMDEPDAPVLHELATGMSVEQVFPEARQYATGASLTSELTGLQQMKQQHLRGPRTYHLGVPRITQFNGDRATVSWCATDSGTTTPNGMPGPLVLDGGPGGAKGHSVFNRYGSRWKAVGGQSVSVSRC